MLKLYSFPCLSKEDSERVDLEFYYYREDDCISCWILIHTMHFALYSTICMYVDVHFVVISFGDF